MGLDKLTCFQKGKKVECNSRRQQTVKKTYLACLPQFTLMARHEQRNAVNKQLCCLSFNRLTCFLFNALDATKIV